MKQSFTEQHPPQHQTQVCEALAGDPASPWWWRFLAGAIPEESGLPHGDPL